MKLIVVVSFVLLGLGFTEAFSGFKKWEAPKAGLGAFRICLKLRGSGNKFTRRDLTSEQYNKLNKPWNLRNQKAYPLGYLLPTTARDVSSAVKCGRKTNIRLIPNSGGNSYESIGWGTNETVVVDFRNMMGIQVEGSGADAIGILEPGANVGQINAYLWENGGYAIPMGSCLTVGIGGHAIGGGLGYYGPLLGLAMDRVIEIEVVDADGEIVIASDNKNPDLFWALKGSGPGYIGIVTRFKVKLFEASKMKITYVNVHYSVNNFDVGFVAFQKFQKWIQENEPTAYLAYMLSSDRWVSGVAKMHPGFTITAVHYQHPTEQPNTNTSFLNALKDTFKSPARIGLEAYPNHIQLIGISSFATVLLPDPRTGKPMVAGNFEKYQPDSIPGYPNETQVLEYLKLMKKDISLPHYVKVKAFHVNKYFELDKLQEVTKVIREIPDANVWILYNGEGGAIERIPRNATAYVHRDAKSDFSLQYQGSPEPATVAEGLKYMNKLWDAFQFMNSGETGQNFPDLEVPDIMDRFYKENYGRLLQSKQKWDPKNYFVSPLSLPVKRSF